MRKHAADVWRLVQAGAHIYVCGDMALPEHPAQEPAKSFLRISNWGLGPMGQS